MDRSRDVKWLFGFLRLLMIELKPETRKFITFPSADEIMHPASHMSFLSLDPWLLRSKSPVGNPQLIQFSREVIDLLKNQPSCVIPMGNFIPSYHHHFAKQCRVSDYGYSKLIELLEAVPHVLQVRVLRACLEAGMFPCGFGCSRPRNDIGSKLISKKSVLIKIACKSLVQSAGGTTRWLLSCGGRPSLEDRGHLTSGLCRLTPSPHSSLHSCHCCKGAAVDILALICGCLCES